ncbi:MAG: RNA polymerase factor sigma-54 [Thermoanaerobaculia bacterium]
MLHPKLETKLEQRLILTPTLQQAIKLLQLNRIELINLIKTEVEQNPVLEEAWQESSSEKAEEKEKDLDKMDFEGYLQELYEQVPIKGSYFPPEEVPNIENIPCPQMGLQDYLIWQLNLLDLSAQMKEAIEYLIDNLDENGYLSEPLEKLAGQGYNIEILKSAKNILMNFDPPGVSAENIKECLLAQAQTPLLKEAIQKGWDEILNKDNRGLMEKLKISEEELLSILSALKYLDPYPGRRYSGENPQYIEPDVYVFKKGKNFEIIINEDGLPKLKLSKFYLRLLKSEEILKDKDAKEFIEAKFQSAFWLLKSMEQRRKTLLNVSKCIVKFQSEAVEKGLKYIRPLLLKNVAEEVGVHESTVSRIVTNKYILTPAGVFLMRDFFASGIKTVSGEMLTVEEIKKFIYEIIQKENKSKPLKDGQISDLLYRDHRIFIARRTVAKYREEMNIPCYKERKKE